MSAVAVGHARSGRTGGLARRVAGCASLAAICVTVAACSDPGEAYLETQSSIQRTLTSEHLAVRSVTCTPKVGDLAWTDPPAHLHCIVRFNSGGSYATSATVQPVVDQPDALTWDGPPPGLGQIDITRAPLPTPTASLAATSAASFFHARNLRAVVAELDRRFGGQSIVQLALYPGELQAVIVDSDSEARLITAATGARLTVGPPSSVNGSRNAIYPSQLDPAVPERLASLISLRGGVPTARLARFVLYFTAQDAGWNIYPVSGAIRFQSLLTGDSVKAFSPAGERRLR